MHHGDVLRGVWVEELALSGLDRAEVERALSLFDQRLRDKPAVVRVGAEPMSIDPKELGFRVDVASTCDAVLSTGRQGNVLTQLGWWLARWVTPARVQASTRIDRARVERTLAAIERRAIGDLPFPGGIAAVDGRLALLPARSGRVIDRERAASLLAEALSRDDRTALDMPLVEVTPAVPPGVLEDALRRARELVSRPVELYLEERDASVQVVRFEPKDLVRALRSRVGELYFEPTVVNEKLGPLRSVLERPPADASFEVDARDRVRLIPSRAGTLVRAEPIADALLEAAASPARAGLLPIVRGAAPKRTTEELLALRVRGLVSRFATHHACCQPRVDNIHRIADLVDGTIVKPGEIVSLNALVGPRTTKNGFVAAPSIEDGEMVDALGGGVSQFATTFFNALFHGGYDIIERQPHTYWFSRYPMGHEATLSWPKPDIIFKNDTGAGLLIKTHYTDTSIMVKLYGDNGGRKVEARVSPQQDIVKPPVELLANPDLEPDREKVKESGQIGWSVIVSRIVTFSDGTKKEEKRKVTYKPRVRRVEVHPCRIPEGEPGYTGEDCPVPESDAGADAE